MFDKRGFLIVGLLFGGVIINTCSSMFNGLIEHGDATYEFKNEAPRLTSFNRGQPVEYSANEFVPNQSAPGSTTDQQPQSNPFMDKP